MLYEVITCGRFGDGHRRAGCGASVPVSHGESVRSRGAVERAGPGIGRRAACCGNGHRRAAAVAENRCRARGHGQCGSGLGDRDRLTRTHAAVRVCHGEGIRTGTMAERSGSRVP